MTAITERIDNITRIPPRYLKARAARAARA